MKRLKNLGMAAVLAVLLVVVGVVDAQAGLITFGGGAPVAFQTPPQTPPNIVEPNDVIPGLWGYLDGDLYLNGTPGLDYVVEFTLIGSESGWTNQLQETKNNTTLTEQADFGDTISYIHTAGAVPELLKFQFNTIDGVNPLPGALVNGANGGLAAARSFFVSFCFDITTKTPALQKELGCNSMNNATTGDVAWIALDDSGAGPNDNHDDWVGYLRVTAPKPNLTTVPDGGVTAGLLGAALLGLGVLRQRFSM